VDHSEIHNTFRTTMHHVLHTLAKNQLLVPGLVLCVQLTRDLLAIAKFLFTFVNSGRYDFLTIYCHSSGGDAAAVYRSLRSLSALVVDARSA